MKKLQTVSQEQHHRNTWLKMKGFTFLSMLFFLAVITILFQEFEREEYQFLSSYLLTVTSLYFYFLGIKNKTILTEIESESYFI